MSSAGRTSRRRLLSLSEILRAGSRGFLGLGAGAITSGNPWEGAWLLIAAALVRRGTLAWVQWGPEPWVRLTTAIGDLVGEALVPASVAWAFRAEPRVALGAVVALSAGVIASYAKVRAGSLGFECRDGLADLPERWLFLGIALLAGRPEVGVWVLAAVALVSLGRRTGLMWRGGPAR